MRITDVTSLSLDDVLARVDLLEVIEIHQWLKAHPALPNRKERWPCENSPIGTYRLDPIFGEFEVLVWLNLWEVVITEGDHEAACSWPESACYRDWQQSGGCRRRSRWSGMPMGRSPPRTAAASWLPGGWRAVHLGLVLRDHLHGRAALAQ